MRTCTERKVQEMIKWISCEKYDNNYQGEYFVCGSLPKIIVRGQQILSYKINRTVML